MNDMIQYKDYVGSVHYSDDDQIFYGKVEHIRSLISFEGENVVNLRANFEEAIDDYLALCQQKNIEPEKPFNVRVGSQIYR
jgi:predicted HicB family RNase H-like nuclease